MLRVGALGYYGGSEQGVMMWKEYGSLEYKRLKNDGEAGVYVHFERESERERVCL